MFNVWLWYIALSLENPQTVCALTVASLECEPMYYIFDQCYLVQGLQIQIAVREVIAKSWFVMQKPYNKLSPFFLGGVSLSFPKYLSVFWLNRFAQITDKILIIFKQLMT